jgi:hypothetical protein
MVEEQPAYLMPYWAEELLTKYIGDMDEVMRMTGRLLQRNMTQLKVMV